VVATIESTQLNMKLPKKLVTPIGVASITVLVMEATDTIARRVNATLGIAIGPAAGRKSEKIANITKASRLRGARWPHGFDPSAHR